MFIIPNTNKWSCIAASFSMALGVSFAEFIELIGHDGGARPYRDRTLRAGFHLQECIDASNRLGYSCTPIIMYPGSAPDFSQIESRPLWSKEASMARFLHYLEITKHGVLECELQTSGIRKGHAVAWDGTLIYDPRQRIYAFDQMPVNGLTPLILWRIVKYGENL